MVRVSTALLLAVAAMLVAAPVAWGVECDTITLTDADGVTWGFDEEADVVLTNRDGLQDGGNVYFDRAYSLFYDVPTGEECTLEDSGREAVFPEKAVAGLQVSAKVFVPTGSPAFVRHLWRFRNAGGSPVQIDVFRFARVTGHYTTTDLLTTSSGDEPVAPDDHWMIWNNAADATDPAVALIWQGSVEPFPISAVEMFDCGGCGPPRRTRSGTASVSPSSCTRR